MGKKEGKIEVEGTVIWLSPQELELAPLRMLRAYHETKPILVRKA